jgi:hypothetical protein
MFRSNPKNMGFLVHSNSQKILDAQKSKVWVWLSIFAQDAEAGKRHLLLLATWFDCSRWGGY